MQGVLRVVALAAFSLAILHMQGSVAVLPVSHTLLARTQVGLWCQVGMNGPGCAPDAANPCFEKKKEGQTLTIRCEFYSLANDDCGNYTGAACIGVAACTNGCCGDIFVCDSNCDNCNRDLNWKCTDYAASQCY